LVGPHRFWLGVGSLNLNQLTDSLLCAPHLAGGQPASPRSKMHPVRICWVLQGVLCAQSSVYEATLLARMRIRRILQEGVCIQTTLLVRYTLCVYAVSYSDHSVGSVYAREKRKSDQAGLVPY
jgi:hypothetical protein